MWSPVRSGDRRPRGPSLAGQFLVLQVTVLLLALAVASVVAIREGADEFRQERGVPLRSAAQDLANLEVVRSQLSAGTRSVSSSLAAYAQQFEERSGADLVRVAAPDGRVLFASSPREVGRSLRFGTPDAERLRTWTGDQDVAGRSSVVVQVPVFGTQDRADDLVGTVEVAQAYPSLADRAREVLPDLATFLGTGLALGLTGAWLLSRLIKRRTRGLEPDEIAALADQREALLHSIREGVVAVADDGTVTVVSQSARELVGLGPEAVGRKVADLDLEPSLRELLTGADEARDRVLVLNGRVVVVNRNPVLDGDRHVGTVTTLRDRTELLAMQHELSARESITETLRAQTHEFTNQLHTISGLVQLEEYDEVHRLVGALTRRRAEITDEVTKRVQDPTVAALLVAKVSVAAERGVAVRLLDGETVPHLDAELSADVLTVLGNLVDNAVDATVSAGGDRIDVRLSHEDGAVRLQVADTGTGVPPEDMESIFRRGYSTKGSGAAGRGVGLALVQVVCERRGGHVSVHNDGGAVFTAVLPVAGADGAGSGVSGGGGR